MTVTKDYVPRNELLFDKQRFLDIHERVSEEIPRESAGGIDIKRHVDTNAMVYEIRSALRYWLGLGNSYRTSNRIYEWCKEIDEGSWELRDGDIVYRDAADVHDEDWGHAETSG